MKQQPQNQASGASETTRFFFCTQISLAVGAAGELKQHKKEPNMANKKNTTPGIGESADFGVMHNPQPSCARTRTREAGSDRSRRMRSRSGANRYSRKSRRIR